jgi:hypothetical protein
MISGRSLIIVPINKIEDKTYCNNCHKLVPGTNASALWLFNITGIIHSQQLTKVLQPIQNVVEICKQITILILHYVTSRLKAPLKFIYSSIQVSEVLGLTVCCKLIKFVFLSFACYSQNA